MGPFWSGSRSWSLKRITHGDGEDGDGGGDEDDGGDGRDGGDLGDGGKDDGGGYVKDDVVMMLAMVAKMKVAVMETVRTESTCVTVTKTDVG